MISPISNAQVSNANQATQPAVRQAQAQQTSAPAAQDTVSLKSTGKASASAGDVDHDGDNK
jgi:hypothetical protein